MFTLYEYSEIDTRGVAEAYRKVTTALAAGDFRAAQVKKLTASARLPLYRARLNDADRLIFTLVRCGDRLGLLLLEVIRRHAYEKSRFLRGAEIDEGRMQEVVAAQAEAAAPLRYLHPERRQLQLLDKPISFDDAQQAVFEQPAPLIVVGSAGSGKTALTLEKLKQVTGEVLYVTHSAFLAQSARELYYAHGFERDGQETSFLSYREFLETLRVPTGQEASWPRFVTWFGRQQQAFRGIDAHQAFEEIRGVISAQAEGVLDREAYQALGVRQSIFAVEQRDRLYDLFDKYRSWLAEQRLFDLNLLAHERLPLAQPRYDFVVIDEVQDLTAAQLNLVLRTLRKPGQFLLCGDSNQIVHPNFFSWAQVKTLFWRDAELAGRQQLRVLGANFRNASETTRIANTLLKIKHRRFGSIDRESNFLVEAVGAEAGEATLLADREAVLRDLDRQSRQSTEVAVLVLREEDKPAARRLFSTPLLFSVHEAKGLEYPNIVLYRFVSDHRAEFAAITEGVAAADLELEQLHYARARDKQDKALEVYKFYVNALYVALTRAVRNVYLVESDREHPLFGLLRIGSQEAAKVAARTASQEDWQREAHKLERQGKLEQAAAIRRDRLQQAVPPWPRFDEARVRETLGKVFVDKLPSSKQRQQLLDYAAVQDAPDLAEMLAAELRFGSREAFERQRSAIVHKQLQPFAAKNIKDLLRQCDQFGVDHRTPFNLTPLMAAAAVGNLPLIEALLERGAEPEEVDDFGHNALHWALRMAFEQPEFARHSFAAVFERVAPAAIDLQADDRLLRIDRQLSEYLLVQTMWTLFRSRYTRATRQLNGGFESQSVLAAWEHLPASVLKPQRRKRSHVSALLSRNEVTRDYAYNRALFQRLQHGWYQFNPALAVRVQNAGESQWWPLLRRLNLALINELTISEQTTDLHRLAQAGGLQALPIPLAGVAAHTRAQARLAEQRAQQQAIAAERARREAQWQQHQAMIDAARVRHARPPQPPAAATQASGAAKTAAAVEPPWGTPEARRLAVARLLERNRRRREGGDDPG